MLQKIDTRIKMTSLTLFVLCHDRPDYARQTLKSILAQTDNDFDLIVSDNSSNDEVGQMVAAEFPQVNYRRRIPMLPALAHFNRCIDEVQTEYFCLFHDDDLMHPDFVQRMKPLLESHPKIIACGCNALIETYGKIEARTSFQALGAVERINSARNLARRYFSRAQNGIAPFPGYIYRRDMVGNVRLLQEGGKYSDVTWLLELAKLAPMLWITAPLMTYRMHGGNDGGTESPCDRLRFLSYLKRNQNVLGKDLLADYRCSFIYKRMLNNVSTSLGRKRLANAFLKRYNRLRYTNPSLYVSLARRMLVKRRTK
jgi:glycosyltransferase involved in cell wall biosynthesis